jgi:hypothetical protein
VTKRIKRTSLLSLLLIFFLFNISLALPALAQDQGEETNAEISVIINGSTLPSIQKNWTAINFTVYDFFGLPWDALKDRFTTFQMRVIWPFLFGIPDIKRYLGYTSISFDVECPTGWSGKVEPATIPKTTGGYVHKNLTLYLQVTDLATEYNPTIRIICTRYDVLGGEYGITIMTLPVKASSLNFAFVNALESTKKAAPRSIVYFPIQISNKGEYRGYYQFKIEGQNGIIGLVSQQTLILEPGETQVVQLGVRTPETFYDVGTPRIINIIVSPLGSSSEQFETNVIVITEGFYISPLVFIVLAWVIIIVLIIYFLFFYLRNKREQTLFGKPQKPWTLPEEKTHLQALKEDDKQAYEQERKMMDDEYKSALLWYQHERQIMRRKPQKDEKTTVPLETIPKENFTTKISGVLKKTKEKMGSLTKREEPKKKPPVQKKKPIKKPKKEPEKPTPPAHDMNKEEALAKIKKEQEKQRRKLQ